MVAGVGRWTAGDVDVVVEVVKLGRHVHSERACFVGVPGIESLGGDDGSGEVGLGFGED